LSSAESVVAVSAFAGESLKAIADVILPLAPLAESEGLFYTLDGQSFTSETAANLSGQARPGWKILRRLGAQLELEGFAQVDLTAIREQTLAAIGSQRGASAEPELTAAKPSGEFYRVGDVAMYGVDGLCRRSKYLQRTVHAENSFVGLNPDDAGRKGLAGGHKVKVSQGDASVTLAVRICEELPAGAVWVKSATDASTGLGDSFGAVSVEAA